MGKVLISKSTISSQQSVRYSPADIVATEDQIFAALEGQIQHIRNRRDLSVEQADEIIDQLLFETAKKHRGLNRLHQKQFYADFADWRRRQNRNQELRLAKNAVLGSVLGYLIGRGIQSIFSK